MPPAGETAPTPAPAAEEVRYISHREEYRRAAAEPLPPAAHSQPAAAAARYVVAPAPAVSTAHRDYLAAAAAVGRDTVLLASQPAGRPHPGTGRELLQADPGAAAAAAAAAAYRASAAASYR